LAAAGHDTLMTAGVVVLSDLVMDMNVNVAARIMVSSMYT
jgi:hypothetical protein